MAYNDFLNFDCPYKDSRFVIIPAPMEVTVSYGKGTKNGPAAILESVVQLEPYDTELKREAITAGVHTLDVITQDTDNPEIYINSVKENVSRCVADGKIPVVLGGEHALSYGVFKGIAENKKGFSILHFDAHLDLRESYDGTKYSHAAVIKRMRDHKQWFKNITAVGIRSVSPEEADYVNKNPDHKVFYAHDIYNKDVSAEISSLLGEELYITFDIDALDPSIMPSTGTPEPGGLSWYQTLDILKKAITGRKVLGLDIVELAPDHVNHYSQFTAAKLLYKMLAYTLTYGA
ncbi:MAG: agmatinase [Pseudomonadota bacterium]